MAYCFQNHYEYRKNEGRHDEDLDHVPEYRKKLDNLVSNAKTIVVVGWRYDAPSAYHTFDYLCKFATVTLIEAFPKNCDEFNQYNLNKYPVEVICTDILEFIKTTNRKFDLCIWQDGPEHVTYEQFIDFLNYAFTKFKAITISTPNGVFPQSNLYGNNFEIHKSTWYDYNYENLGFETAKWLAAKKDSDVKENALMGFRILESPDSPDKKKLFVYPNARVQSQDKINEYWNTTPMSIEGRHKHFKIVTDAKQADLFFMGMISCGTVNEFQTSDFNHLIDYPEKHVFELEGDWVDNSAPRWLGTLTKSGNSSKPEHMLGHLFVRPAVSNLLTTLAKDQPEYDLEFPDSKTWGFRGFPDPFGVRAKTVQIMQELSLPGEYSLTNQFGARQGLGSDMVREYYSLLYSHLLSVCPRGAGVDSIRFYETCFFGRVPVAISDAKWLAEDTYNMSFAYRISPTLSPEGLKTALLKINDTPYDELVERGKLARKYFQEVVVEYFKDPTKYFIEFLKRKNVIQ